MGIEFHICTWGNDQWPGTPEQPLASLEGCRRLLGRLKQTDAIGQQAVCVWLHQGSYRLHQTFVLNDENSFDVPLQFRAFGGEQVRLSGGHILPAEWFTPVRDSSILARLDEAARHKVLQIDLRQAGVSDWGTPQARGFGHADRPSELELFVNDQPMPLSRWPQIGFCRTGQVLDSGATMDHPSLPGAAFACRDQRMTRWTALPSGRTLSSLSRRLLTKSG